MADRFLLTDLGKHNSLNDLTIWGLGDFRLPFGPLMLLMTSCLSYEHSMTLILLWKHKYLGNVIGSILEIVNDVLTWRKMNNNLLKKNRRFID